MLNVLEYTISLQDQVSAKLKTIGINSDTALNVFSKLQEQSVEVNRVMTDMGVSAGSLGQKLSLLKSEREWIPAKNTKELRLVNREIAKLEKEINKINSINGTGLKKWFGDLKAQIPMLNMLTNPLVMMGGAFYKLSGYLKQAEAAYNAQSVAETKLAAVMRNTMNATQDQVQSIMDLTAAQQKLGVIGDEIQLAGAQELSTFVTKKESVERLIPAMNDMLAQQYGLNATQEQAVTIAQMMGKVLDGQTGALSRYGYSFTEAQERVLKHGTELERTAMLSEVLTQYVGGVNEALAQTPEGKLKQAANNAGDLMERMGALWVTVRATMLPIGDKVQEITGKIIGFFERNQQKIIAITSVIAATLSGVFGVVWNVIRNLGIVIGWVVDGFNNFMLALDEGNIVALIIAGSIGAITAAMALNWLWVQKSIAVAKAKLIWDGLTVLWTNIQTASWWKLNAAIYANPVMWIVAGVIALIGVIAYLIMKIDGWRDTWDNLVKFLGLTWDIFKNRFELTWLRMKDTFMSGVETLMKAWYKLQALWDKEGAAAGLAAMESRQNERAEEIAASHNKLQDLIEQRGEIDVFQLKWNDTKLSDVTDGLKRKLGIEQPEISGASADSFSTGSNVEAEGESKKTTTAIAQGGARNTEININFRNMVETISFSGGLRENAQSLQREVEAIMARVLNIAKATA